MLVRQYGPIMRNHFPKKEPPRKAMIFNSTQNSNPKENEDEDSDIANCIINNKKGGKYGKVMLTGMDLLTQNEVKKNDPPKVMLINTAKSDNSMSGVTTVSRSTQGSITWDKDVNRWELTS